MPFPADLQGARVGGRGKPRPYEQPVFVPQSRQV
jgi:hypothetical protein